jgi:hypothetical protein
MVAGSEEAPMSDPMSNKALISDVEYRHLLLAVTELSDLVREALARLDAPEPGVGRGEMSVRQRLAVELSVDWDDELAKRFPRPTIYAGSRPSPSFDANAMDGRETLPPKDGDAIPDDGWGNLTGDDRIARAAAIAEAAASQEGRR